MGDMEQPELFDPSSELAHIINVANDVICSDASDDDPARVLAAHIIRLHEWLMLGGYFPAAWQNKGLNLEVLAQFDVQGMSDAITNLMHYMQSKSPVNFGARPCELIVSQPVMSGTTGPFCAALAVMSGFDTSPKGAVEALHKSVKEKLSS